jgi:hypothetical protein|eukprot:TRINITY_DN505_c0_g1_i1.p1 TRINITY_DN505_c0_g1~~TRINITY_DN505_c0_g1_i1.p1  ORF type:complete len:199 (-),score=16.59 TRINITY_DN505_c0_g1_i1:516-1112(-)
MNAYFTRCTLLIFVLCFGVRANAQQFLIPDEVILQHAGSIGYVSVGAGYKLFNSERGNLDLLYGYVPKSKGGTLHIITAKFAYKPFVINVNKLGKIYPFNPGFFLTYTGHPDLQLKFSKDNWPKGYYFWSEAIRPHLSFSNELELTKPRFIKAAGLKSLSVYSEFNSNEWYLVNYFQNVPEVSVKDVFKLGIGVRMRF